MSQSDVSEASRAAAPDQRFRWIHPGGFTSSLNLRRRFGGTVRLGLEVKSGGAAGDQRETPARLFVCCIRLYLSHLAIQMPV